MYTINATYSKLQKLMNQIIERSQSEKEDRLNLHCLPWFIKEFLDENDQFISPEAMRQLLIDNYIEEDLFQVLRHPLATIVPAHINPEYFIQDFDTDVNTQGFSMHMDPLFGFMMKLCTACEKILENNLTSFIFNTYRPFRFDAFYSLHNANLFDVSTDEMKEALFEVYGDSENPFVNKELFIDLMEYYVEKTGSAYEDQPGENGQTSPADSLPDTITLYRGTKELNMEIEDSCHTGISWTLNPKTAIWFSNRFADEPTNRCLKATVKKDDVLAFLFRREEECVFNPDNALTLEVVSKEEALNFSRKKSPKHNKNAFLSP